MKGQPREPIAFNYRNGSRSAGIKFGPGESVPDLNFVATEPLQNSPAAFISSDAGDARAAVRQPEFEGFHSCGYRSSVAAGNIGSSACASLAYGSRA
jgi:hypothetical protein